MAPPAIRSIVKIIQMSNNLKYYRAYGLKIASGVSFPEFYPVDRPEVIDVTISVGEVPERLDNENAVHFFRTTISSGDFLLNLDGIARYRVMNGSQIIIQPEAGSDIDSVRVFCISNAFAALLNQRKQLQLHGSAFLNHDEVILILGATHAGKSTILANIVARGFKPFSDDVCVPVLSPPGEIRLFSSYPMMKYWVDTFSKVELGDRSEFYKIRPRLEKYGRFFHDQFTPEHKRLKQIFILETNKMLKECTIEPLKGIDAFKLLERQIYRKRYVKPFGLRQHAFLLISSLATLPVQRLQRPAGINSVKQVTDIILSHLDAK